MYTLPLYMYTYTHIGMNILWYRMVNSYHLKLNNVVSLVRKSPVTHQEELIMYFDIYECVHQTSCHAYVRLSLMYKNECLMSQVLMMICIHIHVSTSH